MKKLLCTVMLVSFVCGCSGEPKYVQPTAKGTKQSPAVAPGDGGKVGSVTPVGKD